MAVAHFVGEQQGRLDGVVNFRLTTHFSTSQGTEAGADLKSLSPRGVYLVSDYPPRPGDVLRMGSQSMGGFSGTVDYVERVGSRWGFFVSFEQDSAQAPSIEKEAVEPEGTCHEAFEYYDRLSRLRDFVSSHYTEDISLEVAAGVAALEKTYFSAFFHDKVGITFCSWLQGFRIQKAIELMAKNNTSITDVAFACGFGDLRTFQRAFRKCTGMTAREYKRQASP